MIRPRWPIFRSIASIDHCRLVLRRLLPLALLLAASAASAWNAGGHRISALIAWRSLDARTQAEVSRLLQRHPDYPRWVERSPDDAPEVAAFLEASTWPDDIRRDPRFFTQGIDPPTTALAGFPDMERRLHWHYTDRPLHPSGREKPSPGMIDRQLELLAQVVGDRRADAAARAYALPWLMHLVGDAHQPLHAASRYDADGRSDSGGNEVDIVNPFGVRPGPTNLHRYWDDLPAPAWLRGSRLEGVVDELTRQHTAPAMQGNGKDWLAESWRIARDNAYPPASNGVPELSRTFHEDARAIALRRVTEAGYRLGNLLRRLLGD